MILFSSAVIFGRVPFAAGVVVGASSRGADVLQPRPRPGLAAGVTVGANPLVVPPAGVAV